MGGEHPSCRSGAFRLFSLFRECAKIHTAPTVPLPSSTTNNTNINYLSNHKVKRSYFTLCALAAACAPGALATPVAQESDSASVATASEPQREYTGSQATPEPESKEPSQNWFRKIRLSGSVQTEFLIPVTDNGLGIKHTDRDVYAADVLNNTYFDLNLNAPYFSAGARFEWAKWPLPGFEKDFEGWGVPYFWATGNYKGVSLTAGDFYEQFGSGLILRTYQERSIGIDNALRGARLKVNPGGGVSITALGGKQRRYWEHNSSWIWGGDIEWNLAQAFQKAFGYDYGATLGFSYVGKHEKQSLVTTDDNLYRLHFPENTAAFDGRVNLKLKDFNILFEGATKNNDPQLDNNYTYRRGSAFIFSTAYSSKGVSAFVQAKRSDNMSWRSDRMVKGVSSFINHLPAFTETQTYALAAMYPYSTQADGEWAFQGEVRYQFKRKTALGGKYGTSLRLSGSYISGLDRHWPAGGSHTPTSYVKGSDGLGAAFWKIGELYYADVNFELNKKLSKSFQFTFFYLFQRYNQEIILGHGVNGKMVNANIFIGEGQWKMKKNMQLRFEAQYLHTAQDLGDWVAATLELSLAPHWMFTVTDMQNFNNDPQLGPTNKNYYQFGVTYNYLRNRFYVAYGRTREGYNCSGGICRWVPASKGFTISYNYTF